MERSRKGFRKGKDPQKEGEKLTWEIRNLLNTYLLGNPLFS